LKLKSKESKSTINKSWWQPTWDQTLNQLNLQK